MEIRRSYKKRGSPDCPIAIGSFRKGGFLPKYPHWHPEVEIMYVVQGHITCLIEERQLSFSAGDILILQPKLTHQYISTSPDVVAWYLIFSPEAIAMPPHHVFQQEFVLPLRDGILQLPQHLQPGHPVYPQVAAQLQNLRNFGLHTENYKINRYAATVAICTALVPWCTKATYRELDSYGLATPVQAVTRYIQNRYALPLTLRSMANHVHLHPSYLSTLFKKSTGMSPMQYLTKTRIDAAVILLKNEDLPMSRIAELAGFRSESVFYQRFKEQMGVSPKAYQKINASGVADNT